MSDLDKITKKHLGELLVDEGIVTPTQVQEALNVQRRTGELLGEALVGLGYTTEDDIVRTLCEQFGKPFCKASLYDIPYDVLSLLPSRLLVEQCFVPLDRFGNVLVIAMGGLLDGPTLAQVQKLSGCDVEVFVCAPTDVRGVLRQSFPDMFDPVTHQPIIDTTVAEMDEETYQIEVGVEADSGVVEVEVAADGRAGAEVEDEEMGGTTRELAGVADDDSDWEALFEEAERNVLRELKNKRPA